MSAATFHGGPAHGRQFDGLGRLPTFVRVVLGPMERYDVLNDVDDAPADNEEVIGVYLKDPGSTMFACSRGRGGGGGLGVTYVHLPLAEPGALRTEDEWVARMAQIVGVPIDVVQEQRAADRAGATPA